MEDEDKYSKIYQVGYPNRLPRYTVPVELPPEPLILSENNQRVYHSVVELYMSQITTHFLKKIEDAIQRLSP